MRVFYHNFIGCADILDKAWIFTLIRPCTIDMLINANKNIFSPYKVHLQLKYTSIKIVSESTGTKILFTFGKSQMFVVYSNPTSPAAR